MKEILNIANWFYHNNLRIQKNNYEGNLLLNKLCIKALSIIPINENIEILSFDNKEIILDIFENYQNNYFTNKEIVINKNYLKILKIINIYYGYVNYEYDNEIINLNNKKYITLNEIKNSYEEEVLEILNYYEEYSLNDKVLFLKHNYYIIDENTILTNEEIVYLMNYKEEDHDCFYVYRDETGDLVVY